MGRIWEEMGRANHGQTVLYEKKFLIKIYRDEKQNKFIARILIGSIHIVKIKG